MKLPLLLFALCLSTTAHAADFSAWTHRQTLRVSQSGLTRIELEPALLDASRTTGGAPFHDLRLVSPTGIETPYIITLPQIIRPTRVDAALFKATLQQQSTVLEFRAPSRDLSITEVVLETPAPQFIKAATLAASSDGITWQTLTSGELLCRQNGTERLRIPIPPAAWQYFRVTIDDSRSAPIIFGGAQVVHEPPELRTLSHPVTIRSRRDTDKATFLTLDLGTANLVLGRLRLRTPELVFQRQASILNARRTLFRLKHEGYTGEELDIPVHQIANRREVELMIQNGDSPPLRIDGIEATRHPLPLVFQADAAGEWTLHIGNAQAPAPSYDIAALADHLSQAVATPATASAVEANIAFRKMVTAPQVGETGAALDVSAWSFRRPVEFGEAGVIELELEPEVLAASESDLHDLRILRAGQQIPYLITRPGTQRETELRFAEVLEEESPNRSKWNLTLPFAGFPASEVVIESSSRLFDRTLSVQELRPYEQGRSARTLGSGHWQRRPGQAMQPLHLALYTTPQTDTIQLQTDNGDNEPLRLASVRVLHPVVRVLFRVPDANTAVHLCYGNARATHPRYDLQLVRREFETATKVSAKLGGEEQLPGYRADPRHAAAPRSGLGSPWLWAALALVVGALLWVVAKFLPKAPTKPEDESEK